MILLRKAFLVTVESGRGRGRNPLLCHCGYEEEKGNSEKADVNKENKSNQLDKKA
jgi:hypothetical protein